MNATTLSKYDIALHNVPLCAICNKPVEKVESVYDINLMAKRFRVYCHGDIEEALLDDALIEDVNSVCFGQAFIDKLKQPQIEGYK
ncbi:hypothetical protein UFOVP236_75 [uncultured Caudovirales phage]|uniref:Uncharacterized protein n=1 Tax=uncultured Caudovirales phage TaxID=2100421 RepID=A0A6J7WRW5_9CAUD|nr:hypothetical protein UFOVP236_75 [uncultured Caudovirales phage]